MMAEFLKEHCKRLRYEIYPIPSVAVFCNTGITGFTEGGF